MAEKGGEQGQVSLLGVPTETPVVSLSSIRLGFWGSASLHPWALSGISATLSLEPGLKAVMPRSVKSPKSQQGDQVPYVKAKSLYFIQVCKLGLSVYPTYWNNRGALSSVRIGFLIVVKVRVRDF